MSWPGAADSENYAHLLSAGMPLRLTKEAQEALSVRLSSVLQRAL